MARSRADELKEEIERDEQEAAPGKEDPDAAILSGGPTDPDPEESVQERAETEIVVIGGTEYEMSPDAAAAYREDILSRSAAPPAAEPTPVQQAPLMQGGEEEETDWDTLMFTNPREAARLIEDKAVARAEANIRQQYTAESQRQGFWTSLYAHSPELKGEEALIGSIIQQNASVVGHLSGDAAVEKVSSLTKETIMRLSGKYRKDRKTGKNATETLENSSPVKEKERPAEEGDTASDVPETLGKVLRLRSKRRRATHNPAA